MKRSLIITSFVLFASVFASVIEAYAQDASPIALRPQYIAGEKWVFDKNGKPDEFLFVSHESNSLIMKRTFDGKSWLRHYSLDVNPIKDTDLNGKVIWEHKGEYAMFRFPMRVGKSWDVIYYAQGLTPRRMQAGVTAYEEVTVPAGTFWAFKIEATNHRLDRLRPSYETYWYAPDVKYIVKYGSPEFEVNMNLLQYTSSPTAAKRDDN